MSESYRQPIAGMDETILEEASRLTSGSRNKDYGHPLDDYLRTAALWTALLSHKLKPGEEITYQDAIRCMCAVKLSRDCHAPKRDNMVDLAGYAHCRQWSEEEEKRRINKGLTALEDGREPRRLPKKNRSA